jgi:ATP-binding protein involved in chromosome partitioning
MSFRTYHAVSGADGSGILQQVEDQRSRVRDRLRTVKRVIALMSGKGGVGKSYVAAHLAQHWARSGSAVGVLDADLNGPTIPRLLGLDRIPHSVSRDAIEPAVSADGIRCFSMAQLIDEGRPLAFQGPAGESFVWREVAEAAALREFLSDVAWGTLDVLVIDLPPGFQRCLELCDFMPYPPEVLTVTIPTAESRDAVRRALRAAVERGVRLMGIVENMVGPQFPGDAGAELAAEFGIPLVARLPFNPDQAQWTSLVHSLGP